MDYWDESLRRAVQAMIPEVEGKPCVNVAGPNGGIHVCRRISDLGTNEDSFNGLCDWADPPEARPDDKRPSRDRGAAKGRRAP